MTQVDLWTLENELRTPDTDPLCGVDEAGRGPLAGPVCAAAVMLPPRFSTVSFTMDNPSPVPPMARERILSTR